MKKKLTADTESRIKKLFGCEKVFFQYYSASAKFSVLAVDVEKEITFELTYINRKIKKIESHGYANEEILEITKIINNNIKDERNWEEWKEN